VTRPEFEEAILAAASRGDGCRLVEFQDYPSAQRVADLMVKEGRLFKVKIGHRTIRFYTDRRVAEAVSSKADSRLITIGASKKIAFDGPAVITENTKFTVCPSTSSGQFHKKQFSRW